MSDEFDVAIPDAEALDEIEMLTNLIIETSKSRGPLPQSRVDEILGLARPSADGTLGSNTVEPSGPA